MALPTVLSDVTHAALLALSPHGLQGRARANARAAMLADAERAALRAEAAQVWAQQLVVVPEPRTEIDLTAPAEAPAAS